MVASIRTWDSVRMDVRGRKRPFVRQIWNSSVWPYLPTHVIRYTLLSLWYRTPGTFFDENSEGLIVFNGILPLYPEHWEGNSRYNGRHFLGPFSFWNASVLLCVFELELKINTVLIVFSMLCVFVIFIWTLFIYSTLSWMLNTCRHVL